MAGESFTEFVVKYSTENKSLPATMMTNLTGIRKAAKITRSILQNTPATMDNIMAIMPMVISDSKFSSSYNYYKNSIYYAADGRNAAFVNMIMRKM